MLNTFLIIALIVCGYLLKTIWDDECCSLKFLAVAFLTIIIFAVKTAIDIGRI